MPSLTELTDAARALRDQGRYPEAIERLRAMAELAPENLALRHNLAAALGDAGENREAASILKEALARGLKAPETWLVYARALAALQDFEGAKSAFERLLTMRPLDPAAHSEFAQLIWMRTGDREQALHLLNQAIASNPSVAALHVARAKVHAQTGAPEVEYELMRQAAQQSGGDPQYEREASASALASKNFEAALVHGRAAYARAPADSEICSAYAAALIATGGAKEAEPLIAALRKQFPINQYYIALQATCWRLGDDDRYRTLYDYDRNVFASDLDVPSGWRSLESYVDDLVTALEAAHAFVEHPFYQSVRHGSQISSITGADDPPLRAFAEAAAGPARRYVDHLGKGDDPLRARNLGGFRLFSTWSISLPPSGFHVDHVHPQGWASSACHLRPAAPDPKDEKAGWLKFGEPGVATDRPLEPELFVKPEAGRMVLFPSYMWHGTNAFTGGAPRITIASDIVPAAR